jgi:hypothetical protein
MKQINQFHKGVISDLDNSKVSPANWVFPTANVRFFNQDGQGFICTSLSSNQKESQITTGYIIIGVCEINGVAFIISADSTGSGTGEIGCYPSPKSYTINPVVPNSGGGWERIYKPLVNFTGTHKPTDINFDPITQRLVFNTALLNIYPFKQISMFARLDYDDSYTLFFTDFNEPIKAINTGILQNGGLNNRYVWNDSFPNSVSLIPGNNGLLNPEIDLIENGGGLKYGMYIYFFRYLDINLTPTNIIAQSRACQVYDGNSGDSPTVQGGYGGSVSTKQVTIRLDNIDTNYAYIEIYYTRYYSDYTNNILIEENKLSQQVPITGNSWQIITHTDHLGEEGADISDILKQTGYLRTCKDITHFGNVFYGANWSGIQRHNVALVDFAQKIKISAFNLNIDADTDVINNSFHNKQYKNYKLIYDNVGYFRGEAYSFAIVFVFKDGYKSLSYPVRGLDAYDLLISQINNEYLNPLSTLTNNKGIFRFPSREKVHLYTVDKWINLMGAKFDMGDSLTFLNTTVEGTWIKNNVAGVYFTRTERHENLLYQGLMISQCGTVINTVDLPFSQRYDIADNIPALIFNKVTGSSTELIFNGQNAGDIADNKKDTVAQIPLMYRNYPIMDTDKTHPDQRYMDENRMFAIKNSYGFFGIDYIANPDKRIDVSFIQELGKVGMEELDTEHNSHFVRPSYWVYKMKNLSEDDYHGTAYTKKSELFTSDVYDVPKNTGPINKINGKYISYTRDAYSLDSNDGNSIIWNNDSSDRHTIRDCATSRYLAIETTNNEHTMDPLKGDRVWDYNNSIVNLYKRNPKEAGYNIVSHYNINREYYQISDIFDIDTLATNINVFNGDCFLQMVFIKQMGYNMSWYAQSYALASDTTTQFFSNTGIEPIPYGHGVLLGLVTENAINAAMRFNTPNDIYYPKQPNSLAHVITSRNLMNGDEEFYFNRGYDKILSVIPHYLYDPYLPAYITKKPTAIYYSEQHHPYSFEDKYRIINVNSFKDYDIRYGEINKIGVLHGYLYSIQRDCINQHYIGERKILQDADTASQEIVLGDNQLLSENVKPIAEYGSQHQWSIVQSDNAVYGVDLKRTIIWRITGAVSGIGKTSLQSTNILDEMLNKKWLADIRKDISSYSDALISFNDNPAFREGIVSGFDRKNAEILITFIKFDPNDKRIKLYRTLVFNEKLNMFTCEYYFKPTFYFTLNDDFYSCFQNTSQIDLYLHNIEGSDLELYGTDVEAIISIVVNGMVSEQENYVSLIKQYDAISIDSQKTDFEKIEYETKYQSSLHNFGTETASFWITPVYKEGKWMFPVKDATATTDVDYSIGSQMKGEWLKITLYYKNNLRMELRNIITQFRISHS